MPYKTFQERKRFASKYYQKNKDKWAKRRPQMIDWMRRKDRENKRLVLTHYGGNPPKCACCGETEYEFMTIDHTQDNGAEERKRIGRSGAPFYRWVIDNNYPSGYQVLCRNCNWGKFRGVCPKLHNPYMAQKVRVIQ